MAEPTLYERLGGIFAIAAVIAAEKGEVSAGSQPGAVNWRRWR
jgi:hypothetical protein